MNIKPRYRDPNSNISKRTFKKKFFSLVIAFAMAVTAFAPVATDTASASSWKPSGSQLNGAKDVYKVLRANGYSAAAAAGILGNIQLESGMRANIHGGGYGLCQWTGGRAASLKRMNSHASHRTQAKFIVREMKSCYLGGMSLKSFKKLTSYRKATRIFCIYFERPGIKRMSTRTAYAKAYYYLLKKPGKITLKAYKGSFKVKMSKKNSYIKGYQIAYKKAGTKKWKKVRTKKTYKRFYKKGSKKLYYVKVRTYSIIKGKRYYGEWSKIKKIRTKKIPKKIIVKPKPPAPVDEETPLEAGAVNCQIVAIDGTTLTVAVTSETEEVVQYEFINVPETDLAAFNIGDNVTVHFTGSLEKGTHQYTAIYPQQSEEIIPIEDETQEIQ